MVKSSLRNVFWCNLLSELFEHIMLLEKMGGKSCSFKKWRVNGIVVFFFFLFQQIYSG